MNGFETAGRPTLGGRPSVGPSRGAGNSSRVVPVPPLFPWAWYDTRNVNLLGNFGVTNLSALATCKNLGIGSATYDLGQATGANQPIWHSLGTQGKLNNLPSLFFNGTTMFMASAVAAARSLPCKVGMIYRINDNNAAYGLFDGQTGGRCGAYLEANTGNFHLTGTGDAATGLFPATGLYHSIVCHYAAGVNSYVVIDGVKSALFNPVPQAMTGVSLGGLIGGIFLPPMDTPVWASWDLLATVNAGLTDLAIDQWLWATWGTMQQ